MWIACSPAGKFMRLTLMVTPEPPLTSATTEVPTLCPLAFFNWTVTGLVAANAEPATRAAEQNVRIVKVDMGIVYKKKESGVLLDWMFCMFRFETAGESHGE